MAKIDPTAYDPAAATRLSEAAHTRIVEQPGNAAYDADFDARVCRVLEAVIAAHPHLNNDMTGPAMLVAAATALHMSENGMLEVVDL